jgi:hypothetical protein
MAKTALWIVLIAAIIAAAYFAYHYATKEAEGLGITKATSDKSETRALTDDDQVIITLEDGLYHRQGCERISGSTERVTFKMAKGRDVSPCPYCLGDKGDK